MQPFDENGERPHGDGIEIDPTHPKYVNDRRYDQVRSKWAISHSEVQEGVDKGV